MTNDQVDAGFQALHDAQRAAQMMFMDLRDAGDDAGAAKAKLRAGRLQGEIDNLINKELADWQAGAEAVIPQMTAAAAAAQTAVDEVTKEVHNAQKVVSALQFLDKAVTTAMKFIG
jgi:hypothetical protein